MGVHEGVPVRAKKKSRELFLRDSIARRHKYDSIRERIDNNKLKIMVKPF